MRPHCLICQSRGSSLYANLKDVYFGAPGMWQMAQCMNTNCGLKWLDPAPEPAELWKAYKTYHTHAQRSSSMPWQTKLLRKLCALAYWPVNLVNGLDLQRRRLRYMYLDQCKPGRLLEVGFGGGRFLNRIRGAGWQVEGIDFDPAATARARDSFGLNVQTAELASMQYPDKQFDAIVMSHTIEHLPDPRATLVECHRILKADGRLVISTPNADGLAHALYGSDWRGLEPPRHLQIFSLTSLRELLVQIGFEIEHALTLSSDATGIHYVSEKAKYGHSSVIRSFQRRQEEYAAAQQGRAAGQDLLIVAHRSMPDKGLV